MTSTSGSIQRTLPLSGTPLWSAPYLSLPPQIKAQGRNAGLLWLQPHLQSSTLAHIIFLFVPVSPALTSTSFLPNSSLSIHLSPFHQISSNSSLFSSPQGPYHTQRLHFPCSRSIPPCCWTFPHSHKFSEFITQAQTHPVSWTTQYLFFFPFLFPSLTSPINTIQPTV